MALLIKREEKTEGQLELREELSRKTAQYEKLRLEVKKKFITFYTYIYINEKFLIYIYRVKFGIMKQNGPIFIAMRWMY